MNQKGKAKIKVKNPITRHQHRRAQRSIVLDIQTRLALVVVAPASAVGEGSKKAISRRKRKTRNPFMDLCVFLSLFLPIARPSDTLLYALFFVFPPFVVH